MSVKMSPKRQLPENSKTMNYKRPKIDWEAKELERILSEPVETPNDKIIKNYKRQKIDMQAKEIERILSEPVKTSKDEIIENYRQFSKQTCFVTYDVQQVSSTSTSVMFNNKKDTTSDKQTPTSSLKPCQSSQQVNPQPVKSVDPDCDERLIDVKRLQSEAIQSAHESHPLMINDSHLHQKPCQQEPFDRKSIEVNPIAQKTNPQDITKNTPSNPQKSLRKTLIKSTETNVDYNQRTCPQTSQKNTHNKSLSSLTEEINRMIDLKKSYSEMIQSAHESQPLMINDSHLHQKRCQQEPFDRKSTEVNPIGQKTNPQDVTKSTPSNPQKSANLTNFSRELTEKSHDEQQPPAQGSVLPEVNVAETTGSRYLDQNAPVHRTMPSSPFAKSLPILDNNNEQRPLVHGLIDNNHHMMQTKPISVQKISGVVKQPCQLNDKSCRKPQPAAKGYILPQDSHTNKMNNVTETTQMRSADRNSPHHRMVPKKQIPVQKLSSVAKKSCQLNDQSYREQQSLAYEHSSLQDTYPIAMKILEKNTPHHCVTPNESISVQKILSVAKQPSQVNDQSYRKQQTPAHEHILQQDTYSIEMKSLEQNAHFHHEMDFIPISVQKLSNLATFDNFCTGISQHPSQSNGHSYRKQQSPAHEHILPQNASHYRVTPNKSTSVQKLSNVANQPCQSYRKQQSPAHEHIIPQDTYPIGMKSLEKNAPYHLVMPNKSIPVQKISSVAKQPCQPNDQSYRQQQPPVHEHILPQRTYEYLDRNPRQCCMMQNTPNAAQNSLNVVNQYYQKSECPQEEQIPPAFRRYLLRDPHASKMVVRRTTGEIPLKLINNNNIKITPCNGQDCFIGGSFVAGRIDQRTQRTYPVQNYSNFANHLRQRVAHLNEKQFPPIIEACIRQDPYTRLMFLEKSDKANPNAYDQRACIQGTKNNAPFARQNITTSSIQSTPYSECLKQNTPVYENYPLQDSYIPGVLQRPHNMNDVNQRPISQNIPHNTSSAVQHTVNSANHSCRSYKSPNGKQSSLVVQNYSHQDPRMQDSSVYPESHIKNRPLDSIGERFSPMAGNTYSLQQSCIQEITAKGYIDQNFIGQNVCHEKYTENRPAAEQVNKLSNYREITEQNGMMKSNGKPNTRKVIASTSKEITNPQDKPEKKLNYDVDNDDDRDDDNNVHAKKKPDRICSLVLPPEYDPNDTKWTLKHQTSGPGIVEILPGSSVYIHVKRLNRCKKIASDDSILARMLVSEIFSQNALSVCSLTGNRAEDIDHHVTNVRPSLDEHALQVLLSYVHGYDKGWNGDVQATMQSMQSKIQILRSLYGTV